MDMNQSNVDQGLLLVYGEPGLSVTEAEFNDWYDNEHAPARLTVPGISTAARYKATDGQKPTWIAIYDAADPAVLSSKEYKDLMANASDREKALIPKLEVLQRGIYELITTYEKPEAAVQGKGRKGQILTLSGGRKKEEENPAGGHEWYRDLQFTALLGCKGFIRARRYKLVSHLQLAGEADVSRPPMEYLEILEWEKHANALAKEVLEGMLVLDKFQNGLPIHVRIEERRNRLFEVHKIF